MKYISANVWSVLLLTLTAAASLALIAAAWLMATFCLNGLYRFGLPLGLLGLTLFLSTAPVNAQTNVDDSYFVVHDRPKQSRTSVTTAVSSVADSGRVQAMIQPARQTRKIRPVPAWPDEQPVSQPAPVPTDNPSVLFIPAIKPGSPEVKGLIGVRIRP